MNAPTMNQSEFLARLDERLKYLKETTDAIHVEVKKTNGRVSSLESWRSEIRGSWKATILISSAIGAVVGFLGSYIF